MLFGIYLEQNKKKTLTYLGVVMLTFAKGVEFDSEHRPTVVSVCFLTDATSITKEFLICLCVFVT